MCLLQPYNYTQAPSLTLTMRNHSSQKPATDIIEQPVQVLNINTYKKEW